LYWLQYQLAEGWWTGGGGLEEFRFLLRQYSEIYSHALGPFSLFFLLFSVVLLPLIFVCDRPPPPFPTFSLSATVWRRTASLPRRQNPRYIIHGRRAPPNWLSPHRRRRTDHRSLRTNSTHHSRWPMPTPTPPPTFILRRCICTPLLGSR
jgi:hypothetical protein